METANQIEKQVERQFKLELAAVRELNALSERFLEAISTGRGMRDKADSIIASSAVRETTTFQATLRLVEFGFGRQAMMLNRSTFEGMAVACWIAANREVAVDRFDKANEFEIHLMREKIVTSQPDADISDAGKLDPVRVEECERLFGKNNQRRWTGHDSLWAVVKDIENRWEDAERQALKLYLRYEHERNNKELHPSASALFASVSNPLARQDGRPGMSFRVGPGSDELGTAFLAGSWPKRAPFFTEWNMRWTTLYPRLGNGVPPFLRVGSGKGPTKHSKMSAGKEISSRGRFASSLARNIQWPLPSTTPMQRHLTLSGL